MLEIESVRKALLSLKPSYQNTSRTEVSVRCPYCGDSVKNRHSAHLYVEMKPPFRYHCKRCESSGALNTSTLRDLQIYSNDVYLDIVTANKTIRQGSGVKKTFVNRTLTLPKEYTPFTQICVDYFNRRYDRIFDYQYIINNFKAILDSEEFFKRNKFNFLTDSNGYPISTRNTPVYDFKNSIGFVSTDSSHIIYRDMSGLQSRKYFNLNLDPHNDENASKIYNIKRPVDLLSKKINLIVTEGIFDIIGVYEHFYKEDVVDNTDYIFAAACGKGYMSVINHYLRMGFLDMDITIYSDSDVDIQTYKALKRSPYLKNTPITIYYNNIGKDFGVPKEQIELRKAVL